MPTGGTYRIHTKVPPGDPDYFLSLSGDLTYDVTFGAHIPGPTGAGTGGVATAQFEQVGVYLNGSAAPTPDNSLPLGFTIASAYQFKWGSANVGAATLDTIDMAFSGLSLTDQHADGETDIHTMSLSGMTLLGLLGSEGLNVTFTFACAASGSSIVAYISPPGDWGVAEISGTYTIVGYSWYFNPETGQFQLSASDPGAPWRVQAAGVFDPPVETSPDVWEPEDPNEPAPDVVSIYPDTECSGQPVTITGTGFGNDALVFFGTEPADNIVVVDHTTITCDVPTLSNGSYDITVQNTDGQFDTEASLFTVAEPWWALCVSYDVDGVTTSYTLYAQQCGSPGDDWVQVQDPSLGGENPCGTDSNGDDGFASTYGWYASTAAYAGDVYVLGTTDRPKPPRQWGKVSWVGTGNANVLGGSPGPSCVLGNRLVYAADDYTQGTHYPPIRVYDGLFDRELCRLAPTVADAIPKAVIAMLAANGTVYLSTHESGTSNADWRGRVFQLDLASGVLTPLGDQFAAGELPYALCWHMGRLWCGTTNTIGTGGKIYYFRPGVDTSWTTDYTLSSSSVGGACALASYNGKLYVGTDNAAALRGKVLVRDSAGTYTTSQTGTGGTARVNNGYLSLAVFEGNLYSGYWNNDTTAIAKIEKFDGSSWTTAYTGATTTLRPYNVLLVDNGVLYAFGCGNGLTGAILTTPDGTSWTDRTANILEATARELVPSSGVLVI